MGNSGDRPPPENPSQVREETALSGDRVIAPPKPTEAPKTPLDDSTGTIPERRDVVEEALAEALRGATLAGRWDVVGQLARELEARRQTQSANVVHLSAERVKRGAS